MSTLYLFLGEILAALTLGWSTGHYLEQRLRAILDLMCGTQVAARFWVQFTRLMLLIAPVLSLALFTQPRDLAAAEAEALRAGLVHILSGLFLALAMMGLGIWRFVGKPPPRPATPPVSGEG